MTGDSLIAIQTAHASFFERLKSGYLKEYDVFFKQMAALLRARLTAEDLTEFSRQRMERQLLLIESDFRQIADQAIDRLNKQIREVVEEEADFEVRALSQIAPVEFVLPQVAQTVSAVYAAPLASIEGPDKGKLLEAFINRWEQSAVDAVQGRIRAGYFQGESTPKIVKALIGTKGMNYRDGDLAKMRRNLETVTRTSLQHAAQQARSHVWENNRDIIAKWRVVATLDRRTSTRCRSLDGSTWNIGEGPQPPIHPNCRTTSVPVLKGKLAELDAGTQRSQRDPETGKVSKTDAQTTYYDWLKRQSAEVQDGIIGVTRGKLLRNGGLTSEQFAKLQINDLFQPITLDEMKRLNPLAFQRAGIE